MKRFLKEPGHSDSYENLKVNFIPGRTPVLTIKGEDGSELEKIDLSKFKTEELHALMIDKGFERKVVGKRPELKRG